MFWELLLVFRSQLFLIIFCFVGIFIFVMLDLWAGVRKSKQPTFSYGFQRTIQKMTRYCNYYIAFVVVDILQMVSLHSLNMNNDRSFWLIPVCSILSALFVGITEIKSMFEKESKKERRKIEESAKLMAQIAELMTNPESREKLKELSLMAKKKEEEDGGSNDC